MAYELETVMPNGRTVTCDDHLYLTDRNRNGATLEGIIDALEKHVLENMEISLFLYTEAPLINTQIMAGNIEKWERAGYMTSKGEPVKYADLWEQINGLLKEKVTGGITGCAPVPWDKQRILEQIIRKE